MERSRMRLACLLNCCVLACCFAVEGARPVASSESTLPERHRGRSLLGAYDVGICRWFQDSSCQLNPLYARHVLSSSSPEENSEVQKTILDEAECLSMTHEAACISRTSCEWIGHDAVYGGRTQNLCQFYKTGDVIHRCTYPSLRSFVMEHMRCRKQLGGRCNVDGPCSQVKLSADHQGCGISGPRVLDLITRTPASQTEVVAHLVESASALQRLRLADVTTESGFAESTAHQGYRRLFQTVESRGNALQVDEVATGGTSATKKSDITGTGSVEGEETSTDFTVSDEGEPIHRAEQPNTKKEKKKEKATLDDGTAASPHSSVEGSNAEPEKEDQSRYIQGELIFEVSANSSPQEDNTTNKDVDSTEESLKQQIKEPLVLRTPIDHLLRTNASVVVDLKDFTEVLDALTTVLEKGPQPLSETHEDFVNAASKLESMRFRLDSQTLQSIGQENWNTSNDEWWRLQESAELLDAAYISGENLKQTAANVTETLSRVSQRVRETWNPRTKSRESKQLTKVEERLKAVRNDGVDESSDMEGSYVVIDTLDKLVSVVVDAFKEELERVYPRRLSRDFAAKYNQTWVLLHDARNRKWRAVQAVAASENEAGEEVVKLVQGLYRTRSPNASDTSVPYLKALSDIVADLVGSLIATHASDRYKITNLPEPLRSSDGLHFWQNGPQIAAAELDNARRQAIRSLENSYFVKFDNLLTVSDKVVGLLEATIGMIDAKVFWRRSTQTIPEATTILSTMEAALNVITDWNKFALVNHLNSAAEEDPYGRESIMGYVLSLVGCMQLGMDENGACFHTDRSQCRLSGIKKWNNETGQYSQNAFDRICVPVDAPETLKDLFDDLPESAGPKLVVHIRDIYILTAYCPSLTTEDCGLDERCDLFVIEDRLRCRPSSNFMNYLVEDKEIIGLSATTNSCQAYLGLPVCRNYLSTEACLQRDTCLWTQPHLHGNFNGSAGMCSTDWVQQLKRTDAETLHRNGLLPYNVQECREQRMESDCRQQSYENDEAQTHETQLPRSHNETPQWLAYTLSIVAAFAVASTIFAIWRLVRKDKQPGGGRKKKGKLHKKGDPMPFPRMPPPLMYAFETEPGSSPNRNRDDFAFVVDAIENANSFSTLTRSRSSVGGDGISRGVSGTATEMSEIQPISETEESESSDSGGGGWTSSSDEWSIDDEVHSLPEVPT